MPEAGKGAKLVAGTRQVQRQIAAGRAARVLLARDADDRLRQTLQALAEAAGVPVEDCESMAALGRRCRIAVPCAAAAELSLGEDERLQPLK
ncbi:MAG: ribosomal L7Ae/L30e/S12e/Gadd45 family protein [Clostridia bacterium]|nr:ribosomal L7Ae/L30e/S12e/Gadd45 family protein [Clostridia bacterium]